MPSTLGIVFADLLRQHRLAAGLTQEALAERAGLSVHGIQKLERGATHPYRDTTYRLVDALGLAGETRAQFEAAAAPSPRRRKPATTLGTEVSLCHAAEDQPIVERVAALLREAGLSTRTESSAARPHDDATAEPSESMPCAVFVGAKGSGNWDAGPLDLALRSADIPSSQRLIPILLPGAPEPFPATSLPPGLATQPWVDLRAGLEDSQALEQLVAAIRGGPDLEADLPRTPRASVEVVCPYRG